MQENAANICDATTTLLELFGSFYRIQNNDEIKLVLMRDLSFRWYFLEQPLFILAFGLTNTNVKIFKTMMKILDAKHPGYITNILTEAAKIYNNCCVTEPIIPEEDFRNKMYTMLLELVTSLISDSYSRTERNILGSLYR